MQHIHKNPNIIHTHTHTKMEMKPMIMAELEDFPEQFTHPFQYLSDPPLLEFSGGSSTSNHHTTPPQSHFHYRYPPPAPQQKPAESVEAMREMIFRMAALQPVQIEPESVKPQRKRNVKISKDPQSVAARHRRERIRERIRILQRLVPGGTKMVTASMLDEAAHYMKFLKKQVQSLEQAAAASGGAGISPPPPPPPVWVDQRCWVSQNHHEPSWC